MSFGEGFGDETKGADGSSVDGARVATLSGELSKAGSLSNDIVHTLTFPATGKKTYTVVASGYFTATLGANEGFHHRFISNVYRSGGGTITVAAASTVTVANMEYFNGVNTKLIGGTTLTIKIDTPAATACTWTRLDVYEA